MSFKRAMKRRKRPPKQPEQEIHLENPVAHHFDAFIAGNAQYCDRVAEQDSKQGQHLLLCGAGPSLADHIQDFEADEVWGCNSAAPWLYESGHPVTHAFTVDQTPAMVAEWKAAPPIEYLVASSIHPFLTEHLLEHDRALTWFHNFVGIRKENAEGVLETPVVEYCSCGKDEAECECDEYDPQRMTYEDWLYSALYPPTVTTGSGLNAVNRALDLALYMGFERITILGADCALRVSSPPKGDIGTPEHDRWLREETQMHADGGHAMASGATPVTLNGVIDGRLWVTKPDMAVSALWLVVAARHAPDRIKLVGDTYPNALLDKPDSFLARLPGGSMLFKP